jgi:hypothetical protein
MSDPATAPQIASPPAAPAAPGPSATAAPAPRTAAIADNAYQRLPADQQNLYASVKNGDSGAIWVKRDQLPADAGPNPDQPAADQPIANADGKHKFGEMEFTEQELRDFLTAKADAELRKASLPASPAEYKAELPANFELPGGTVFEIAETDPLLIDARNWAHSKGMDQAAFSELVGIYASSKASETAQLNAAHAAEVAKMGANGTSRVTALETWLRGVVGDRLAGPMRSMMVTADIVKGLEILQSKFSSQGTASFSQAHREPRDAPGIASQEQYDAMTPGQRLDYSRSFDQRQFQR